MALQLALARLLFHERPGVNPGNITGAVYLSELGAVFPLYS